MTTKFEVGKEYLSERGDLRMRIIATNEWGAAFEHMAGAVAGQFGHCAHCGHGWRPAPRTVERWIVETRNGLRESYDAEEQADDSRKRLSQIGHEVIVARISYEVPW